MLYENILKFILKCFFEINAKIYTEMHHISDLHDKEIMKNVSKRNW